MRINDVLSELQLFSDRISTLEAPVNLNDVRDFENRFGIQLHNDYIELLKRFNGIDLIGKSVYGVGKSLSSMSLEDAYLYEHNEVNNPMFDYLLPFSPDGAGNYDHV